MKPSLVLAGAVLVALLGLGGFMTWQDTLIPVPLAEGKGLFVPASPEYGEETARLEAVMPAGPGVEAFLSHQSALTLLEKTSAGGWTEQLAVGLQTSRHGRRWRVVLRPGWRMQDGSTLEAAQVQKVLGPEVARLGGELRAIDATNLEFRFKTRRDDLPTLSLAWRIPGSGPFVRRGNTLSRFEAFTPGKTGIAELTVVTDPAALESHAWAQGLASGRWAWAVFPGQIAPEDMAKVRLAPYDEIRMKDGSVWFLSRRLRRLRPDREDWTRTRLFGAWKGAMDLPFDPLGL